jgi:hypothetical protein
MEYLTTLEVKSLFDRTSLSPNERFKAFIACFTRGAIFASGIHDYHDKLASARAFEREELNRRITILLKSAIKPDYADRISNLDMDWDDGKLSYNIRGDDINIDASSFIELRIDWASGNFYASMYFGDENYSLNCRKLLFDAPSVHTFVRMIKIPALSNQNVEQHKIQRKNAMPWDDIIVAARQMRSKYPDISIASVAASIAADLPLNPTTGKLRDKRTIEKRIGVLWERE